MKQPLLSSVWSVMLDGKSSSCKIKALEGLKPTGVIIFEFIKLYSYGLNSIICAYLFYLRSIDAILSVLINKYISLSTILQLLL